MVTERKSRRRRRKKILCRKDGSLYDVNERRRISAADLRDYVRDGGLFEARREESGADCTYEVLQSVVGVGLLNNLVPGMGGGPLPGLAGLGRLGGLVGGAGPLGALGGAGSLGDLARLLGDHGDRGGGRDRGWDDWDEPTPPKRRPPDEGDWAEGDWDDRRRRPPRRDSRDWASDPDFD